MEQKHHADIFSETLDSNEFIRKEMEFGSRGFIDGKEEWK